MRNLHERKTYQKRIAYLTHTYPNYSTTFTRDELQLLAGYDLTLTVYSLRRPPNTYMTPELLEDVKHTIYLQPLPVVAAMRAHGYALLSVPYAYVVTLFAVLWANRSSLLQFLKSFLHFFESVYLGREFLTAQTDLVHVQLADTAATYAAVVQRIYNVPYSVAIHAHEIFEHRYAAPLIRFRVYEAARIRVISDFNKRWLVEQVGIPPEKIEVIRCGIDGRKFAKRETAQRPSPPVILAVGRLVEQKGFRYLVRACRALLDAGHMFSCKIIGNGPERSLLERLIHELELTNVVELLGVVQHGEMRQQYRRATVFVLPCCRAANGEMDGIPVALMEAMAMEIPVVSTEISGIPELIESGVSGLLVPPEDGAALAKAIGRLLQDEDLWLRMGRRAREKVLADFDLERNVHRLANMLMMTSRSDGSPQGMVKRAARELS